MVAFIYIYIIGNCNPLGRIKAWLLTSLMLRVLILYISGGTYSLISITNDRSFENLFHGGFIYYLLDYSDFLASINGKMSNLIM